MKIVYGLSVQETSFFQPKIFIYMLYFQIEPCIISVQVSRDTWTEICLRDYLPEERVNFIISWSSYRFPLFFVRQGLVPQFSLTSLEEARNFLFSEQKTENTLNKSIYIDGPYCLREVSGEVIVK